jgi:hypothetical protein
VIDDAQGPQTQEVHLDQAHVLAVRIRETGDDHAVSIPLVHRDEVKQRGAGEDDGGGVYAGLSVKGDGPQLCDGVFWVFLRREYGELQPESPSRRGVVEFYKLAIDGSPRCAWLVTNLVVL